MSDTTTASLDARERLELVRWLIDSYDQRKASLANRLSILLSADAILLAATTFLVDTLWSGGGEVSTAQRALQIVGSVLVFATLGLLFASIVTATSGMANVWKTHHRRSGSHEVGRLFFYPRQTFDKFEARDNEGFPDFVAAFQGKVVDALGAPLDLEKEALGHLWVIMGEYRERYGSLRRATRLFVYSIVPLVLALAVILARSL